MYRPHIALWILGSAVVFAGLGAWGGSQLGDGRVGHIALISAVCAVLGSFLPGAIRWARTRRHDRPPHRGPA